MMDVDVFPGDETRIAIIFKDSSIALLDMKSKEIRQVKCQQTEEIKNDSVDTERGKDDDEVIQDIESQPIDSYRYVFWSRNLSKVQLFV